MQKSAPKKAAIGRSISEVIFLNPSLESFWIEHCVDQVDQKGSSGDSRQDEIHDYFQRRPKASQVKGARDGGGK